MKKIGLISDTHSFLDPRVARYFEDRDEIWHAGDVGNVSICRELEKIAPLRAVYGNIDGDDVRKEFPENLRFQCEGMDVWITHIGGRPGKYDQRVAERLKSDPPDIFICGHSHILKIQYDHKGGFLYINPGAAGKEGFHKVRTILRFAIEGKEAKDMEVVELKDDAWKRTKY